ncbi:DUF6146 family protein [Aequorivita marina]|uniref:DUF6146 family protein n=1 Tax=Aequorivita marina TaxID=3073654 RepID=UPI002876B93A|nr:DUF6146 family protein [Aequorivita sp. S2608]MDS1297612.1 DUF6146 family protein [Aequorivita sp. S2608]
MKKLILLFSICIAIYSCGSSTTMNGSSGSDVIKNDTIRIGNESLDYEIIIIEPGFDSWLVSQPPRGHYGQSLLEAKNQIFVAEFNNRVLNPGTYSKKLYGEQINYDPTVDYGYEVNYLLYNYFVYFQEKYDQTFNSGRK